MNSVAASRLSTTPLRFNDVTIDSIKQLIVTVHQQQDTQPVINRDDFDRLISLADLRHKKGEFGHSGELYRHVLNQLESTDKTTHYGKIAAVGFALSLLSSQQNGPSGDMLSSCRRTLELAIGNVGTITCQDDADIVNVLTHVLLAQTTRMGTVTQYKVTQELVGEMAANLQLLKRCTDAYIPFVDARRLKERIYAAVRDAEYILNRSRGYLDINIMNAQMRKAPQHVPMDHSDSSTSSVPMDGVSSMSKEKLSFAASSASSASSTQRATRSSVVVMKTNEPILPSAPPTGAFSNPQLQEAAIVEKFASSADQENVNPQPKKKAKKIKAKNGFGVSKHFGLPEDVHQYSNQARSRGIVAGHTFAQHEALGGIKPELVVQMAQGKALGVKCLPSGVTLPSRFSGKVAIVVLQTDKNRQAIVDALQWKCNSKNTSYSTAARYSSLTTTFRDYYGASTITFGASIMPDDGCLTNEQRKSQVIVFPVTTPEEVRKLCYSDGYAKGEAVRLCLQPGCFSELLRNSHGYVSSELCPSHDVNPGMVRVKHETCAI